MESPRRTEQDILNILCHAKLDSSEVQSNAQCLRFATALDNQACTLIEVTEDVLRDIQSGDRVTVKGEREDHAVLCTADRTHEVRLAETSNAMLLIPDCRLPEEMPADANTISHTEVCAMKYEYYEIREIKPRLRRIKDLLAESVYDSVNAEQSSQARKYSLSELVRCVQASEAEIKSYLKQLMAVEVDGYVRLISSSVQELILENTRLLCQEKGWDDRLWLEPTCDMLLHDFHLPKSITSFVLTCFSEEVQQTENTNHSLRRFDEIQICRFYAETILRPFAKFNLDDFILTWQQTVPDWMTTSLSQLEGLSLVDRDCSPQSIRLFSPVDLSEDVQLRFKELFTAKEKWTKDEITPYIQDLSTDKLSVAGLLTKYARASTSPAGHKVYSSKKPL